MPCQVCDSKKCCEAHIWARSWHVEKNGVRAISRYGEEYPKKRPNGLYDKNIICSDCDTIYGKQEEYTSVFFNRWDMRAGENGWNAFHKMHLTKKCESPQYIHEGIIFTLWKMHHSKLPELRKFSLGPFYPAIHRALFVSRDVYESLSSIHALLIYYYHDFSPDGDFFMAPVSRKISMCESYRNFIEMWVGNVGILIKLDRRPLTGTPKECSVSSQAYALGFPFKGSTCCQMAADCILNNPKLIKANKCG